MLDIDLALPIHYITVTSYVDIQKVNNKDKCIEY